MTSIMFSSDVDTTQMPDCSLLAFRHKLRHFTWHTLTRRPFNFLNACMVLINNELVHVKHGKCIFVLRSAYPRVRTITLT